MLARIDAEQGQRPGLEVAVYPCAPLQVLQPAGSPATLAPATWRPTSSAASRMPPGGVYHGGVRLRDLQRRSGSLVHELLARHPEVGFVSNLEDRIPGCRPPPGVQQRPVPARAGALTRKGRLRYALGGLAGAGPRGVPDAGPPSRDLRRRRRHAVGGRPVRRFFGERADAQAKPVFLHKLTGWPRAIRAVFPDARIPMVRDGRALIASDLRVPWWRGWAGPEHMGCGPLSEADLADGRASGRRSRCWPG